MSMFKNYFFQEKKERECKPAIRLSSSLDYKNNFKNSLSLMVPNFFKQEEEIKFELFDLKNYSLKILKPIGQTTNFYELGIFKGRKENFDLAGGFFKYLNGNNFTCGFEKINQKMIYFLNHIVHRKYFTFNQKLGFQNQEPFFKLIFNARHKLSLKFFYFFNNLNLGILRGNFHDVEKLELKNIRGFNKLYQEKTGTDLCEFNSEIGLNVKKFHPFIFSSVGFLNDDVGMAYGCGLKYQLPKFNFGIAYNFPFKNENIEKISFIFDYNF